MKKFVAKMLLGLVFCLVLTSTGYGAASGTAYREEREAVLSSSDCQVPPGTQVNDIWLEASQMSKLATKIIVNPGDYIRVALITSAGTGYEWRLTESKLSFLQPVKEQVVPFPNDKKIAGGKVAYIFLYKAPDSATGEDSLTFALYRQWEGVQKGAALVNLNIRYTTAQE